eukprot:TRINITY_DN7266_c0_g1_i1.p1 TRINITY_DN7266_c0_g1~~TRINITY_DN7266_c0_g1_i1.p1  ORF type:complete len:488 (-),score=59.73 TRINITY_DN7266_c0_g1_i1:14-1477(-)
MAQPIAHLFFLIIALGMTNGECRWTVRLSLPSWSIAAENLIVTNNTLSTCGELTTSPLFTTKPITSGLITSGQITSGPITSGPITSAEITSGPITSGPITSSELTTSALTTGAISSSSSDVASESHSSSNTSETKVLRGAIIGAVVGTVVLASATIGIVFFVLRRRLKKSEESSRTELSMMTGNYAYLPRSWEMDYKELKISHKVGRGSFGEVYKAVWRNHDVAVKKIRPDMNTDDFLKEASILQHLRPHPNVIQLYGVCREPLCIIVQYYENGGLKEYLQTHPDIDWMTKVHIMKGIAAGLSHLHHEKIVHRDVAARNVLLNSKLDAFVSDFGFARLVEATEDGVGTTSTNMGPVKHMAPECLNNREYSEKSDAWAFGITCLEIITQADPYPQMNNANTIAFVLGGRHQNPPEDIDSRLRTIITRCFSFDPNKRPSLQECFIMLHELEGRREEDVDPKLVDQVVSGNYYLNALQEKPNDEQFYNTT